MTEAEARDALRAFIPVGSLEQWIADQPWQVVRGGWAVAGADAYEGWTFRLETVPDGVRVLASAGRGEPARWFVPA